jgi:hypothetical protein
MSNSSINGPEEERAVETCISAYMEICGLKNKSKEIDDQRMKPALEYLKQTAVPRTIKEGADDFRVYEQTSGIAIWGYVKKIEPRYTYSDFMKANPDVMERYENQRKEIIEREGIKSEYFVEIKDTMPKALRSWG